MLNWCDVRATFKSKNKIGKAFCLKHQFSVGIGSSFSAMIHIVISM